MADNTNTQIEQQPAPYSIAAPNPALKRFQVLIGTWKLEGRESGPWGEVYGQVSFEWLDGGYFLVQHVDFVHVGHKIKAIEIIGYGRDWMGNQDPDCTSHLFDNDGNAFNYVWDLEDDTLTIWGGERGSPAYFKGTFSADRNSLSGRWVWPGGGYETTMTRVTSE